VRVDEAKNTTSNLSINGISSQGKQ
jgi:hypothetical protein